VVFTARRPEADGEAAIDAIRRDATAIEVGPLDATAIAELGCAWLGRDDPIAAPGRELHACASSDPL